MSWALRGVALIYSLKKYFEKIEILKSTEHLKSEDRVRLSEARLKYAIYMYFDCKRRNDFREANEYLAVPESYMSHCQNAVLISKVIRFQAISQKESGNRKRFFDILLKGVSEFPQNQYLLAVYNANLAAEWLLEDPDKALTIVDEQALPAAKSIDEYLHLWICNDRLIYGIRSERFNNKQVLDAYQKIVTKAEHLCSITDKARAENTYGAFCYKYSNDKRAACEHFKNAVYMICKHECNSIMAYFVGNYIQMLPRTEKEEFDFIADMLLNWYKENINYVIEKTNDPAIPNKDNKIIMSLYSFADTLRKRNDQRYRFLIKIKGLSNIFEKNITMNQSFFIREIPIILF